MPFSVIPAKAGIQLFQDVLDPGFRRGDASRDFYETINIDDLVKSRDIADGARLKRTTRCLNDEADATPQMDFLRDLNIGTLTLFLSGLFRHGPVDRIFHFLFPCYFYLLGGALLPLHVVCSFC